RLEFIRRFDIASIPPREWLYGRHYQRGVVSGTVAPGGRGKSSLVMVEAVAMATCRNLLGEQPAADCASGIITAKMTELSCRGGWPPSAKSTAFRLPNSRGGSVSRVATSFRCRSRTAIAISHLTSR